MARTREEHLAYLGRIQTELSACRDQAWASVREHEALIETVADADVPYIVKLMANVLLGELKWRKIELLVEEHGLTSP